MSTKIYLYFVSALVLSISSCKKDESISDSTGNTLSNIVVSGYLYEESSLGIEIPVLWNETRLSRLSNNYGTAYGLAKNGNDIYACGVEDDGFNLVACIWKNGVKTAISPNAIANSIFIEGQNVYAAGVKDDTLPFIYLNGVIEPLQLPANTIYYNQIANDIKVSNGNVIVAGAVEIRAAVWINNTLSYLSPPNSSGEAHAIATGPNGDYVCGQFMDPTMLKFRACYWLNGNQYAVSDGSFNCYAYDIAVAGNDIYICGAARDGSGPELKAVVWKNGVMQSLTGGQTEARAHSIAVKGNDVYVCGFETDGATGNSIPKYWKNGIPVTLSSNDGAAYAIIVN